MVISSFNLLKRMHIRGDNKEILEFQKNLIVDIAEIRPVKLHPLFGVQNMGWKNKGQDSFLLLEKRQPGLLNCKLQAEIIWSRP